MEKFKNRRNGMGSNLIILVCLIVLGVVGFYFYNFHASLSGENADWGAFGSYFGGILSPIISGVAVYLIAKTYALQKRELGELKKAQAKQIELSALTAILNSNLTNIGILQTEKSALQKDFGDEVLLKAEYDLASPKSLVGLEKGKDWDDAIEQQIDAHLKHEDYMDAIKSKGSYYVRVKDRIDEIEPEIDQLRAENEAIKTKIEILLS